MPAILFMFIIFVCHCAVYMYRIMILKKPLANFHQSLHWSYCWNVFESLFKWTSSIDWHAHIFFFKTKNCFKWWSFHKLPWWIEKMLHNNCISAVAMLPCWARRGLWAFCLRIYFIGTKKKKKKKKKKTRVRISQTLNEQSMFDLLTFHCTVDSLKPHFYIVKLGFKEIYIIFLMLKYIDC